MVPERDGPTTTGCVPFVDLALTAPDGRRLGARVYEGDGRDVVVVAPATGVRQRFYDGFAQAVQARGATAFTFDYRGIGDSRNQHPRRDPARMREWGTLDIEAALRHAASLADERGGRVLWVGQSAGICFLPLAASRHVPERIVSVSGLSGHWRLMQRSERGQLWAMWYLLAPVLCRVLGYAPRWAWGGEDLPSGVMEDWMRWCRDPDYLFGDPTVDATGFGDVTAPILAIRATDDPWATSTAHAALHDRFTAADVEVVEVGPADIGASRIGHIDLLRRSVGAPHWPRLLDWLLDR